MGHLAFCLAFFSFAALIFCVRLNFLFLMLMSLPTISGERRLITYRRIPDAEVDQDRLNAYVPRSGGDGATADDLNPFRKGYFTKFKKPAEPPPT